MGETITLPQNSQLNPCHRRPRSDIAPVEAGDIKLAFGRHTIDASLLCFLSLSILFILLLHTLVKNPSRTPHSLTMRPSTLILPTLASSIAASSTARSAGSAALYFADTNALVPAAFLAAHSLAHDSTATTYLLGCHASYDFSGGTFQDDMLSSFCRHKMPITMTQGPSTVAFRRGLQFRAAGATLYVISLSYFLSSRKRKHREDMNPEWHAGGRIHIS